MSEFERGQIVGEYVVLCRPGMEAAARSWADERGLDGAEIRASAYIPAGSFYVAEHPDLNDLVRGRDFDTDRIKESLFSQDAADWRMRYRAERHLMSRLRTPFHTTVSGV